MMMHGEGRRVANSTSWTCTFVHLLRTLLYHWAMFAYMVALMLEQATVTSLLMVPWEEVDDSPTSECPPLVLFFWGGKLKLKTSIYKSSNTGWISADRSSKATLPLTIPSSSKVVCNGFTPMTFGIVIRGYALAFGRTECILSRVTSLGNVIPHLDTLLT